MIQKSGGLAYPLFRLETRLFDYWSPLCHLRLEELCTLLWCGANRHIGHCRKLRLHVGILPSDAISSRRLMRILQADISADRMTIIWAYHTWPEATGEGPPR